MLSIGIEDGDFVSRPMELLSRWELESEVA
jgi:hypothetical protein